ncbi:MAG TPA: hypothetical protein VIF09_27510, partial [Polyangiaceae bacterium]
MRTTRFLLALAPPFAASIVAACLSSNDTPPPSFDGGPPFDAGTADTFVPSADATTPDATALPDAPVTDAAPSADADASDPYLFAANADSVLV